jgi:hypothetical protein
MTGTPQVIRATQWEPLCEVDPTPGKAGKVEEAGERYSAMAEEIDGQVRRLKDIVDGTTDGALQGGYVQSLTAAAEGLRDGLGKTSGRYREVGGTLQGWAPQLRDFQDEAEGLRQQAVSAQGDMAGNRAIARLSAVDAPPPPDEQVAADKARAGRYDDADADLRRAQSRLVDLCERRDAAAARIADAIRDECHDAMKDGRWDNFKDWMDEHAELIDGACKMLGVVAMAACVLALVVPGVNVLAATALLASAGTLLGHSALAVSGNGSWVDVGMDAVALGTFGVGRFLGPGLKVFGKPFGGALGRLTAETKAAGAMARGNAARAPIQTQIKASVSQARQRLVGGASKKAARSVRREVIAVRAQGAKDSQLAYNTAESAYLTKTTNTTLMDRLVLGGGDSELAAMRVSARDATQGFSTTSKVGLAAAKANTQAVKSVAFTRASNAASWWSSLNDFVEVKPYQDIRDRFPVRTGGDL